MATRAEALDGSRAPRVLKERALEQRAHPARGLLAVEQRPLTDVAEATGYCAPYVGRVLNKRLPATPEFRRRLAAYLGRSETELFDDVAPQAVAS